MKMTSWGCCVLVYERSGEPVVLSMEPGLPRTDVCGSESQVARRLQRKKLRERRVGIKRAPKSPLTVVFESWLLSILHCRFWIHFQWLFFICFPGDAENESGSLRIWRRICRRGDWSAVEGTSHCCYQEHGTVSWGAPACCLWGFPQSRSEPGVVGAGVWWG